MRNTVNQERDFEQIKNIIERVEEIIRPLNVVPNFNVGNYSVTVKFRFDGMVKINTIYYNSIDLDINRLIKRVNNEFLPLVKFNKSLPYLDALSKHELRYSVNQERDFGEFKNTLTEIILCDVSNILKGSIVNYLGVELCDNCVIVIISNGTVLTRFNIFYDDVINSMNKFIKRVKEYEELKKWEIVEQCKQKISDEHIETEILLCKVADMVEDTDTRLGTGFIAILNWIVDEYLINKNKDIHELNIDELNEFKDQLHRLIKYVQGNDI